MGAGGMTIEIFLMVYCFPLLFTVGVIGNLLNLVVLLDKRMRSKTNILLSVMAVADIFFLVFMMVHSLMYHTRLMRIPSMGVFFVYAAPHIAGVINMCSFVSAWIIVLVSVERMTAVMWPLKARSFWTCGTIKALIGSVIVMSFLITVHSHVMHEVKVYTRNETLRPTPTVAELLDLNVTAKPKIVERKVLRSVLRSGMESYWRLSTMATAILIVFLPVIFVIVTNAVVFCALRRQKGAILMRPQDSARAPYKRSADSTASDAGGLDRTGPKRSSQRSVGHILIPQNSCDHGSRQIGDLKTDGGKESLKRATSDCLPNKKNGAGITAIIKPPSQQAVQPVEYQCSNAHSTSGNSRNQRRATFIVFIIASTFTVSQTPSALIHICEIIWPYIGGQAQFKTFATLSNSMVVAGKTMNLFLFCMWSSHFRRNLQRILSSKLPFLFASARKSRQLFSRVLSTPKWSSNADAFDRQIIQVIQKHSLDEVVPRKESQKAAARLSLPVLMNPALSTTNKAKRRSDELPIQLHTNEEEQVLIV